MQGLDLWDYAVLALAEVHVFVGRRNAKRMLDQYMKGHPLTARQTIGLQRAARRYEAATGAVLHMLP